MEYKLQTLKAGSVPGQFESVKNFKITKPAWKKSYGEDFFLTKSDSLSPINITRTNILDVKKINGFEYVLSNDTSTNLNVSVNGSIIYTGVVGESKKMLSMRGGYNQTGTGTITSVGEADPTKDPNDVFEFGYIRLQLSFTPVVGDYITFTSNTTNLQGISTKIHYVQSGYAYIRGTNLYGTLPTVGETVVMHDKIGDVAVIGEKNKVVAVYEGGTTVTLYQTETDDEIIDIEKFNSTVFVLTKKYVFFGRSLVNCNINIYPLDFFDNMSGGVRIVSFGKHLILFGDDNQVISPVNGTGGAVGYVTIDLNYDHGLFSKYSILSTQGSMYILQDDKQFVKVNIVTTSNSEYDVETENALANVQGMLDEITGDVYITKNDKYISIINDRGDGRSIAYNYNLLYQHWVTWEYAHRVKSLGLYPYGHTQYTYGDDIVDQEISFELGGDSLHHYKTCYFVKMIFVTEENKVPDYKLIIDKYIGGLKTTSTTSLKDFPINNKLLQSTSLGYDQFSETGLYAESKPTDLGYIIQVTVRINKTADLFVFTLQNNNNILTYAGGVVGYKNWLPEVTAYNYTLKESHT